MSGNSYGSYNDSTKKSLTSTPTERKKHLKAARESLRDIEEKDVDFTKHDRKVKIDKSKALLVIEKPVAKKNYLVVIDASGSNEEIANHFLQCGGFFLAPFSVMGVSTSFAFIFFSDHNDRKPEQDIGFVLPSAQGDDQLSASLDTVRTQNGYDIPEMIECVMKRAAEELPIDGTDTTFVLVTDSVAHGMGYPGDEHTCGVDWRESLKAVQEKFSDFILIGCTDINKYPKIPKLQEKFFSDSKKKALNFIDLASVKDTGDRQRLVVNALQFVAARDAGLEMTERYFKSLYDKLMAEGVRGQSTDSNARDRIARFAKYLDISEPDKQKMLARVFGED